MAQSIGPELFEPLRLSLVDRGYAFESRPHQVFLARNGGTVVSLYESGKVVISGSDRLETSKIAALVESLGGTPASSVSTSSPIAAIEGLKGTRVGSDEAGKGDYFGPLVTAAVLATQHQADVMREMGVRDSKQLENGAVFSMANELRKRVLVSGQWRVVPVPPARYNVLMAKMGNLNRVLGWAHARAIEEVLKFNEPVSVAVADQFGDPKYIEQALFERGRKVRLIQTPKGERDVVVAAASILAREGFLASMESMSREYGVQFPRGSSHVEEFAREFVSKFGSSALLDTAKVHFATTSKVVESTRPLMQQLGVRVASDSR